MTATLHPIRPDPARVKPERFGSYKDWLAANRKTREWRFEPTAKSAGDIEMTSKGFDRHAS